MKGLKAFPIACAIALLVIAAPASATTIPFASRAAFDAAFPGAIYETWDSYAAGTTIANGGTLKGITYNSSAGIAVVQNNFLNSTPPNGLGRTPINFFDSADTIQFTFGTPLTAFGIDINTFATASGAYTATTNNGDVVGSFFNPFPGAGTGQFVGFSSTVPFTSVTIATPAGSTYTLDSLRAVPVPEPATIALLGTGLAGALAARRRRSRE